MLRAFFATKHCEISMRSAFIVASLAVSLYAGAQERPLYEGAIPNAIDAPDEEAIRDSKEVYPFLMNISRPTITPHVPKNPTQIARL